jgi:hypothetical protein
MKENMLKFDLDTTPTFGSIPKMRSAIILPSSEKIKVIDGSHELIFGESFVQGINSMNRIGKFRESAITYVSDSDD